MRLPIKFICRANKMNSDGTSTVFIQYCYNAEQKRCCTLVLKSHPRIGTVPNGALPIMLPAHHGNHEAMNKELRRLFRIAEDLVSHAIDKKMPDKGAFVKRLSLPT
ncbi:hypothetical protein [Paraflavitalea speifideaquila]|uniref:hypothetical protein n=1 Tax=Paraflavitalea speifideaquila TaxID=3076558 RepID=UPI0028EEDB1C|nr:hypothetical protein [Paraflavitalea speifideiaquila]